MARASMAGRSPADLPALDIREGPPLSGLGPPVKMRSADCSRKRACSLRHAHPHFSHSWGCGYVRPGRDACNALILLLQSSAICQCSSMKYSMKQGPLEIDGRPMPWLAKHILIFTRQQGARLGSILRGQEVGYNGGWLIIVHNDDAVLDARRQQSSHR